MLLSPPSSKITQLSRKIICEIFSQLQWGGHIALIGARQSGKALILQELKRLSAELNGPDRPKVVTLRSLDFQGLGENDFLARLSSLMGVDDASHGYPDYFPLAEKIMNGFRAALRLDNNPLWLFVQNIAEFSAPIVRALLLAIQEAAEAPEFQQRIGVVVTGNHEFVSLTYDENSPYRHAHKFFFTGFDRELTEHFFASRICGDSLDKGFEPAKKERSLRFESGAMEYLHSQTGGYARFIEEIIITESRPGVHNHDCEQDLWTKHRIELLIERFLNEHVNFEYFCRLSLGDVEADKLAWNVLLKLYRCQCVKAELSGSRPHLLETSGIVKRYGNGRFRFASPIWERFIRQTLTVQRQADVYAMLGEWDEAWQLYDKIQAADCHRPLDGQERYLLNRVILDWEDCFVDKAAHGSGELVKFFQCGLKHLFGVSSFRLTEHVEVESSANKDDDANVFDDIVHELRLFSGRFTITSVPKQTQSLKRTGSHPSMVLQRLESFEYSSATVSRLKRSIGRFWNAYLTAKRNEYDITVGALRERHLLVVSRLNNLFSKYPGDMQQVVQGTVNALIDIGGYYRTLISLVSPTGDRIQGVASRCSDPLLDLNFKTDYPLEPNTPSFDWNVQQWVVINGKPVSVPDASDHEQMNPKTNSGRVLDIGMKGIAVIPLKIHRLEIGQIEILGTLHIERPDKEEFSDVELSSLEILAGQIAMAFDHARRFTMLEGAFHVLEDEVRILSPTGQVVFRNRAALLPNQTVNQSWNFPISSKLGDSESEWAWSNVLREACDQNLGVHHYVKANNAKAIDGLAPSKRSLDEFAAPIYDFRSELTGNFVSDGRLGFVHKVCDLSDFVQIHEEFQRWLGNSSANETVKKILSFFESKEHDWCRIYLYQSSKNGGFLKSFAQFGIEDPTVARDFFDGKFSIERGPKEQAWFLIEHVQQLAVFEYLPDLERGPSYDDQVRNGFPTILVNEPLRKEFYVNNSSCRRWLEAPLMVGSEIVGLLVLSMPRVFTPQDYEKLRSCVVSVAVAIDNSLQAEQEIGLQKEAAWKSAAQLAVHQLSNKLGPAESACKYAREWISRKREMLGEESDLVSRQLFTAQNSIAHARGILKDFRRYASERYLGDVCQIDIRTLMTNISRVLEFMDSRPTIRVEPIESDVQVDVSNSALTEVFEVLFQNSIQHSGLEADKLQITLSVGVEEFNDSSVGSSRCCCITYQNNGRSIDSNTASRMFEPFFTTSQQGNGLGLAIARQLLTRQRGWLFVDESNADGVKFRIHLPVSACITSQGV